MIIEINGLYSNLKFSSSHIVFGHKTCGGIHGHTYYLDVKLFGEKKDEFLCDFKIVKKIAKNICKELDHKLLLPKYHKHLIYELRDKSIYFKYKEKEYLIPVEDVILLPIPSTSAEDLAIYIANKINKELNLDNIKWIETSIYEGLGQKAVYRLVR
ncbi:6-carboxytetrahydropterin synthase [Methanocaldococcus indicus]|uniref:6-carboxytetrahydropterin synthase n=1 Tax=Methanocaldococcus indicus TaxID=213231 RepID=UPI003C6D246E